MNGACKPGTLAIDLSDLANEAHCPYRKEQRVEQYGRADRIDREGLRRGAADRRLRQAIGRCQHKAGEQLERVMPRMMRFEGGAISRYGLAEQWIARENRRCGADLLLQFTREGRRDQAPKAFGRAQAHEPAQLRDQPIGGAAGAGRDRYSRQHADAGSMREGAIDELREVDPDNADRENAETGHRDGERRREISGRRRSETRFRGCRQAEIEPAGLASLDDARPQRCSGRRGFSCHARASPSRKSSALSRLIWGTPSPAARSIRGGWNTGNSVKRSPQKPSGGGVTGTMPGKNRMRRSPPSGNPITTSTLCPSITSVPSSVQRIEASAIAATRACAVWARSVGTATRLAISASRWSRCSAGT